MATNPSDMNMSVSGFSPLRVRPDAYARYQNKKNISVWTQKPEDTHEVFTGEDLTANARNNGRDAARAAVILKAEFTEPSTLCTHPVENGALISDCKVIQPKKCTLTLAMPASYQEAVIKEIEKYYQESTFLAVHDVSGIYGNMVIVNKPHVTDAKTANRLVFTLDLEEVKTVAPAYVKLPKTRVKDKKHASTVSLGVRQAKQTSVLEDARKAGENVFYKFFKSIGV